MTLLAEIFQPNHLSFSAFDDAVVLQPNNWNVGVMLFLLVLFAAIVATSRGKISQLMKALVVPRHYSLILREGKMMEQRSYRFLLLFDMLTYGLGLTTLADFYAPSLVERFSFIGCFLMASVGLFLIYLLKMLFYNFYIKLFDHSKEKYAIHLHKFIFISVMAIVLYVALLLFIFAGIKCVVSIYLIVLFIFTIVYFYNLCKINPKDFNLFHFFVYFCTLEILPYLILVKFVSTL